MFLHTTGILYLLHDNRIFSFGKKKTGDEFEISMVEEQNLLLNIVTTAKFRAMGFLYSGYQLLDNCLFLLIILLSIRNNNFGIPREDEELALFVVLGLEAFYDVMLYTHRYWILQRLSIYIVIVLYCIYFWIVALLPDDLFKDITREQMYLLLVVRFSAFVLETLVDIAIDIELHNDLIKLGKVRSLNLKRQSERDNPYLKHELKMKDRGNWMSRYMDVSNSVIMLEDVDYRGSLFAWGMTSVFDGSERNTGFPQFYSYCLCAMPTIPASVAFVALLILCCTAGLLIVTIQFILSLLTWNLQIPWSLNYWKEILHF